MNLADLVHDAATDHPAKPALIFQGKAITFEELDERVDTTAAALASLGVRKGDHVALIASNVPEFVNCLYGAMRAGAVVCPLNVMLTPEEVSSILADAGARVAITDLASLPGVLSIRDGLAEMLTVVVIGGPPAPAGTVSLEEAMVTDTDIPDVRVEESDPAVIAYTAGTTAEPKGAVLTHRNLLANLDQMASVPNLAMIPEDVVLLALPMFHIYALNAVLGLTIKTGATAVLMERFDPAESLELVERHAVTILFGVPPMFSAWLSLVAERRAKEERVPDLLSVRMAVSGSAPLPPDVFERFRERFGITIWEGYGLTEAAPAVTTNAAGSEARPGSIGLPLPGVDIRLIDENGQDVEEDDPGEIWVRGPNVFSGYWQKPEESSRSFEGEWLKTGDVAYRDDDGYLHIVDRKKDLIIVSGFNVYPKEVEQAIERHPKVAEAAIVGIPDERTGEAVQAWVVPREGEALSSIELLEFLQGHLARFKRPKEIQIVDELPHHETGKVLRRALRRIDDEDRAGEPSASDEPDEEGSGREEDRAEPFPGADDDGEESSSAGSSKEEPGD